MEFRSNCVQPELQRVVRSRLTLGLRRQLEIVHTLVVVDEVELDDHWNTINEDVQRFFNARRVVLGHVVLTPELDDLLTRCEPLPHDDQIGAGRTIIPTKVPSERCVHGRERGNWFERLTTLLQFQQRFETRMCDASKDQSRGVANPWQLVHVHELVSMRTDQVGAHLSV